MERKTWGSVMSSFPLSGLALQDWPSTCTLSQEVQSSAGIGREKLKLASLQCTKCLFTLGKQVGNSVLVLKLLCLVVFWVYLLSTFLSHKCFSPAFEEIASLFRISMEQEG